MSQVWGHSVVLAPVHCHWPGFTQVHSQSRAIANSTLAVASPLDSDLEYGLAKDTDTSDCVKSAAGEAMSQARVQVCRCKEGADETRSAIGSVGKIMTQLTAAAEVAAAESPVDQRPPLAGGAAIIEVPMDPSSQMLNTDTHDQPSLGNGGEHKILSCSLTCRLH